MRVVITGHTGLIGSALAADLVADGHTVVGVSRRPHESVKSESGAPQETIVWDVDAGTLDQTALEGADAVVHLAGETVQGRWTKAKKERILRSRVRSTKLLAGAVASLDVKPSVFVSGSAMGIYGDRGETELTEQSATASGSFLADVCVAWEGAALSVESLGVRLSYARTGLVLSPDGGALSRMALVTKLGAGGPLGNGKQWWSWVSIEDTVAALRHMIDSEIEGPVNITAPVPVRQREFAQALGTALRRPSLLPAPGFAIKAVLGGFGGALLESALVMPAALEASGFVHLHRELRPALRSMLQDN